MNQLLEGMFSGTDFEMRPRGEKGLIAEGWKGALIQCRGDWEFYTQVFDLLKWNNAERCCWLCKASNTVPNLLWTNFKEDAGWRATLWSHESYMRILRASGAFAPTLLTALKGFKLTMIHVDVLHTVDQGVASHIVGNVLRECMQSMGSNEDIRIQELTRQMHAWYKEHPTSSKIQGKLTIERLKTDCGYPKLKAKAYATRVLTRFALHVHIAEQRLHTRQHSFEDVPGTC